MRISAQPWPELILGSLLTFSALPIQSATLVSTWTSQPRKVTARFDQPWQETRGAIRLENGWLFARNDQERLYLLIDLSGDTVDDRPKPRAPWGDYVSLVFDVDRDSRITAGKDLKYAQYPGSYRLGRQEFQGQGRFSGLQASRAWLAANFGASPVLRRPHRIWEFAIPLSELNARPGGRVKLGVATHSERPSFSDALPLNQLRDLKDLIELRLSSAPALPVAAKLSSQQLRQLVAGRRLVVRPQVGTLTPVPGRAGGGPPSLTAPGRPNCPMPEGEPVRRDILANGTVELTFANGSKKQNIAGGWKILCPDGTEVPATVLFSTQIPPTLPPALPDQVEAEWLEYHNRRLLGIISSLVSDPAMVDNYLDTESDGWSVYERIQTRSETISYLLAE